MKCPKCNGPMQWEGRFCQGGLVCRPCEKEEEKAALARKRAEYAEMLKAAQEAEEDDVDSALRETIILDHAVA